MEEKFIKLTNATYKALDFFPENDPLRNKAKEKALEILENLSGPKKQEKLVLDIEILESYLKLGKLQGWINEINFLIILKEYEAVKNEIIPSLRGVSPQASDVAIQSTCTKIRKKHELWIATSPRLGGATRNDGGHLTERQTKILEMLGKAERAQVSDFIKQLPDVTKRTIRRDLDDLLKRGRIARVGQWNSVSYQMGNDRTK